ncbi:hypothetical protein SAMN04488121_1031, partial [Chitinophaga filiformis]
MIINWGWKWPLFLTKWSKSELHKSDWAPENFIECY